MNTTDGKRRKGSEDSGNWEMAVDCILRTTVVNSHEDNCRQWTVDSGQQKRDEWQWTGRQQWQKRRWQWVDRRIDWRIDRQLVKESTRGSDVDKLFHVLDLTPERQTNTKRSRQLPKHPVHHQPPCCISSVTLSLSKQICKKTPIRAVSSPLRVQQTAFQSFNPHRFFTQSLLETHQTLIGHPLAHLQLYCPTLKKDVQQEAS